MFEQVIHCDWSKDESKRWMATAQRTEDGWSVDLPKLVPKISEFLDQHLFAGPRTLAGFDFPIGLPENYGNRTGLGSFMKGLPVFGQGEWSDFFQPAERPEQISLRRPFYPHRSLKGLVTRHQLEALNCTNSSELLRKCEHKTNGRRNANSLFWTTGSKQVGKAAIDGWQFVVRPAQLCGAALWPFEGNLNDLAKSRQVVICETYPAEAYGHIGIKFLQGQSKKRQSDRQNFAGEILEFAEKSQIHFTIEARHHVDDGFSSSRAGEDAFDAFVGLLSMISVVDGNRSEGKPVDRVWEGWILGQQQ